ncbi:MAG: tetratricopeptide repeat protein [Xenococcaceae cyanobacterium]
MPIFNKDNIYILFVHVPKTGGSSVEQLFKKNKWKLSGIDGGQKPGSLNPIRHCSPQHMHLEILQTVFDLGKIDYIFMTVRHPVDRLLSEYRMRKGPRKELTLADWFETALKSYLQNPFCFDNHLRPQSDFWHPSFQVFKLENGYSHIIEEIEQRLNIDFEEKEIPHVMNRDKIAGEIDEKLIQITDSLRSRIELFYRKDFELFDYQFDRAKILSKSYISAKIDAALNIQHSANFLAQINTNKKSESNTINMLEISEKKQSHQGVESNSKQSLYVYKSLGDALVKQEKFEEASAAYQKAITLSPENAVAYRGLGHCYDQSNNDREAIINYEKAIALEENQPAWVYKNLGNLYFQNRQPDRAFDCYLKAVQLQPDAQTSYGKLGLFHGGHAELNFNQLDKAIECYQQAIDKQPNFFLPYVYLGDSLTAKNDLARAISYYHMAGEKKLLAKYPELRESQYDLDKVKQPNFIIIGAGKSGTSSLYEYICSHPQVISSLKKELRFFSYKPNFKKGVDWYLSHFSPIPKGKNLITGEATPGYFGWDVQESIYNSFPNIKLIAILRNPVDRAFSQYNHWIRNGIERRSFQEAVTAEIEKLEKVFDSIDILDLKKIETIKEICRQVRKGNSKEKTGYLWEGLYVYFLHKWTSYFSKEQLLVIKSEDFYARPEIEMKKVFAFLGLPDYQLPQYKKYNAGKYSSIDEQLYNRISKFFKPHNQRLEEYLNRKLDWI